MKVFATTLRRSVMTVFGVLMLMALAVGSTFAAPATDPAQVSGKGALEARGVGAVALTGSGRAAFKVREGEVLVTGPAEIKTRGKGTRETLADGTVRLRGWGEVVVIGDNLNVKAIGKRVEMVAIGTGSATLKGKGSYHTRGKKERGEWTPDGVTVAYS